MKNADTAMFHGKGIRKNPYQYYTAQMNIAVKRRVTLESALRPAVIPKDFVLHYQPQVNLETGEVVAMESLVRWKSEDSGTVMPDDFIPLAEQPGLIVQLDQQILGDACREAACSRRGLPDFKMAVNMSAPQFQHKPGRHRRPRARRDRPASRFARAGDHREHSHATDRGGAVRPRPP